MTTDPKPELPVFEFEGGRKMYPPYVLHCAQEFEQKISMGDPEVLGEVQRFNIMQAYFAGFARAASFVDTLHDLTQVPEDQRKLVLEAIQGELKEFSRLNREFGAQLGVGHVRVKNG